MGEEINTDSRIMGMLGFARRAGKVNFGFDSVLKEIAIGKVKAVLLSADASPRTSAKIKEACEECRIKLAILTISKEQLGHSIGREDTAVVAISDRSFAKRILELANSDLQKTDAGDNLNTSQL
jgi:ribosomal protein L7Ae-like RNA K-turn-binding protein